MFKNVISALLIVAVLSQEEEEPFKLPSLRGNAFFADPFANLDGIGSIWGLSSSSKGEFHLLIVYLVCIWLPIFMYLISAGCFFWKLGMDFWCSIIVSDGQNYMSSFVVNLYCIETSNIVEGLTGKICTFLLADLWLRYYYGMIVWFVGNPNQSRVVHVHGFNLDF